MEDRCQVSVFVFVWVGVKLSCHQHRITKHSLIPPLFQWNRFVRNMRVPLQNTQARLFDRTAFVTVQLDVMMSAGRICSNGRWNYTIQQTNGRVLHHISDVQDLSFSLWCSFFCLQMIRSFSNFSHLQSSATPLHVLVTFKPIFLVIFCLMFCSLAES